MENLEQFIQNNISEFNTGEMPAGHKERFLNKLSNGHCNNSVNTPNIKYGYIHKLSGLFAAISAAAILAIAFFVAIPESTGSNEEYRIAIQEYAQEMYQEETELLISLEEEDQYMVNEVKSITNEPIPLPEQLPDELSQRQRAEILKNYYQAKTAALRKMKTLYAQNGQPIE